MVKKIFNPMELDALGEMMNISLGSSATAVSNMLEHRVDITTPRVTVVKVDEFELGDMEPAMGVQIKYVEGLDGSNIMLLRRSDVKLIVDILMGTETPDEEFELSDLTISAVCEVMNQMMGSAATAMSEFLGYPVNISTPEPFSLDDLNEFKHTQFPQDADEVVVVRFSLKIEDALESEFMNVMSVDLAKDLLKGLGLGDMEDDEVAEPTPEPAPAPAPAPASAGEHKMTQEEIERMMAGNTAAPAAESAPAPAGEHKMTQEEIEKMMAGNTAAPAAEPAPAPAGEHKMTQEEIEKMMAGNTAAPAAESAPAPAGEHKMTQEEIERMMAGNAAAQTPPAQQAAPNQMPVPPMPPQMQPGQQPPMPPYGYPPMDGSANPYGYMGYPPMYYGYPYPPMPKADPKIIETKPVEMKEMQGVASLGKEQSENLDLIMEVPLQVTVEIGRTHRKVQDILEFSKGSLVVLDKLAGDQVDLFVNGKCIARGDVVVVDDNFGVRITEIVQKNGLETLASK